MSNPLPPYFSQRVKNLFNHLHDFERSGDDISLHDLRVEMKKLRAILIFLRTIYPNHKLKKASQKIRSVFQESGEIREYQLLQQWLVKNEFTSFDKDYFPKHVLGQLVNDFRAKTGDTKQVLKEVTDDIEKYIQATNPLLAEQYVVDLYVRITNFTGEQPAKIDWHGLRKLIKQWIYGVNRLGNDEVLRAEPDLSYYDKLQEAFGNWHDAEVIHDSLYQKQIYLSNVIAVQKDFARASTKIKQSIKYRERQVGEMLARKEVLSD